MAQRENLQWGAEILELIDQYERDKKQEAEVLGALRGPGNAREAWIAAGILFLNERALFEKIDAFQGGRIAAWLGETKGKLTTTTWKAAWSIVKKYQRVRGVGKAPEV